MLNYSKLNMVSSWSYLEGHFPCSVVNNLLSCSERAILRYESELNSILLHSITSSRPCACLQTSHLTLDALLAF